MGLLSFGCGEPPSGAEAPIDEPVDEPVGEVSDELKIATDLSQPLSAGLAHACAILEGGALKCWGSLALGVPGEHGSVPNTMGNSLPSVSLGAGRTAVSRLFDGWAWRNAPSTLSTRV